MDRACPRASRQWLPTFPDATLFTNKQGPERQSPNIQEDPEGRSKPLWPPVSEQPGWALETAFLQPGAEPLSGHIV